MQIMEKIHGTSWQILANPGQIMAIHGKIMANQSKTMAKPWKHGKQPGALEDRDPDVGEFVSIDLKCPNM